LIRTSDENEIIGKYDDGKWRELGVTDLGPRTMGANFKGSFFWNTAVTIDGGFFSDTFVFWGNSGVTFYQAIRRSASPLTGILISDIQTFDDWLLDVTGMSLSYISIENNPPYNGMNFLDFFKLTPAGVRGRYNTDRDQYGFLWNDYVNKRNEFIKWIGDGLLKEDNQWGREWKHANELVFRFIHHPSFAGASLVGRALSLVGVLNYLLVDSPPRQVAAYSRDDTQELSAVSSDELPREFLELLKIAPGNGNDPVYPAKHLASIKGGQGRGIYRISIGRSGDMLNELSSISIGPRLTVTGDALEITEKLSEALLQTRRAMIRQLFTANSSGPQSNLAYLEEAYYFVPVCLALELQSRGEYVAALDWYRTVYDYSVPINQRKIYFGLVQEESLDAVYQRASDWLLDPLNPHTTATTRAETYTRFTVISLIRCFLAFADTEFTRDTAESVPRARILYLTALDLLDLEQLHQRLGKCDELILNLDIKIDDPHYQILWNDLKKSLAEINDFSILERAIREVKNVLSLGSETWNTRFVKAWNVVENARKKAISTVTFERIHEERVRVLNDAYEELLTQPEIFEAVRKIGELESLDFKNVIAKVSGINVTSLEQDHRVEIPWLREKIIPSISEDTMDLRTAREVDVFSNLEIADRSGMPLDPRSASSASASSVPGNLAVMDPLTAMRILRGTRDRYTSNPPLYFRFCIPLNPVLKALRLWAQLNLYKIRHCRNIVSTVHNFLKPEPVCTCNICSCNYYYYHLLN
jgi:hypothetical protein